MYLSRWCVGGECIDEDEIVLKDSDFFVGRLIGLFVDGVLSLFAEICIE